MNKQKLMYEAPTAQTFAVRFEGMICQSIDPTNSTEKLHEDPYDTL